jgi:thiaminase/transcriptional activator TenA
VTSERLSDRMLRENAAVLAQMVGHRFVRDIRAGRLPREVFDRYLGIEGAFVDTAIAIFALATAKAGGIATRRRLIAVLDALANEQVAYFERVLAARGIAEGGATPDTPGVAEFRDGMLRIAEAGSYADIATAMFAAEWMYWTWCRETDCAGIADPHLRDWVALHAEPGFEAQARWLKDEVDREGGALDAAAQDRLVRLFGEVQRLEIAFHEAAYAAPGAARTGAGGGP